MNFKEAYQKMKEGKKVRRKGRSLCCFYDSNENKFCTGDGVAITGIVFEAALADDWEVVEEPKSKVWKPKPQEMYYFLAGDGTPTAKHNLDDGSVEKFISIGNCFETGEEADHMVEKLKVIRELQDLSNIKFNMSDYVKNNRIYYIAYDFTQNRIVPLFDNISRNIPFNVYFSTKEDCEKAITKIGKDRIKKYYFDIED
jgi:hypothetical protein